MSRRRWQPYNWRAPSVLVCHEKHGDRFFAALTEDQLDRSITTILRNRLSDGYWYEEKEAGTAWTCLTTNDIAGIKEFIASQSDGEYEKVSLYELEGID